jgi:hypothetical protein
MRRTLPSLHVLSLISLLSGLLAGATLGGCLPKSGEALRAPSPTATSVATVLDYPDKRDVGDVPSELQASIAAVAAAHDLPATIVPGASIAATFSQTRSTGRRLAELAKVAPEASLLLLVEAAPEFYSQLNGRYRWTVNVQVTLAPRAHIEEALTSEFKVPVFLQFYHEKEPEALKAAIPIIERHLSYLLDEYVGGMSALEEMDGTTHGATGVAAVAIVAPS